MIRTFAVILASAALGACSVLSSPDPVQLYRFGDVDLPAGSPAAGRRVVVLSPVEFPEGAGGDRILTTSGGQAAYLAGARWLAPAQRLYVSSLEAAFLRGGQGVTLSDRREAASAGVTLDLDITSFEARYLDGADAAPTVVIAGRARLVATDRSVRAERTFRVDQPAGENRVSAIVAATDAATARFNEDLVTWVAANAG